MSWLSQPKPIIALAPMADMTDGPFCRVCREVAGDDFVIFREMVSAEAIVRDNEKTLKMCAFEKQERPIITQIFGGNAESITEAAKIIVKEFEPDGIDVNMGCPVPKIAAKNHAGAALMKDHDRACEIVRELKKADLGVPVSVKTRLGWSNPQDILDFAPKLQEAGADLITIHGRTKAQGYSGKADWEMIAQAKKRVTIPVIANGDMNSREDIDKCLEVTGADGVMIGRAALGNPWIFTSKTPDIQERVRVVLRHAELHIAYYGSNSMVTFRKHLALYFKGMSNIKNLRQELVRVRDIEELKLIVNKFQDK